MLWLLLASAVVFVLVVAVRGATVAPAAMLAGLVCFVPASLALLVTGMAAGTPNSLNGTLFGVLLRTCLPFLLVILLTNASRPLVEVGLFGMVLTNYLVVLAVETVLAVRLVQTHTLGSGA